MTKVCTLLLLLQDDQILLAMKKRGFGMGLWNGVGGKVEPGESIDQAVVRECQEEIGVSPISYHKVAVHDFIFADGTADMQVHAYICRSWHGQPVETEEMAPRWFTRRDIPYDTMWDDDQVWLPLVLNGTLLTTRFTFDANTSMVRAELTVVQRLQL